MDESFDSYLHHKVEIREMDQLDAEKIDQARSIFVSYFTDLYKNIPPQTLGITNVPVYLEDIFQKTVLSLQKQSIRGFFAYIDQVLAGFSTCGLLEDSITLLLRTIPIQLGYKQRELEIRNAFLSHFHKQFPTAKRIVMMVRKANTIHASLCEQSGFKNDNQVFNQSAYLKNAYTSKWYDPYVIETQ